MPAKTLWEILVPANSNDGIEYSLEHHKEWDTKIRELAGGLTILRTTKGQWINPDGKTMSDRMIPVRVLCTEEEINNIIQLTLSHYNQEAVLAYQISSAVKLVYRNSSQQQPADKQ